MSSTAEQTKPPTDVPAGYERIACPMCGGTTSHVALQGCDRVLDESVQVTVVRCDDCGLCFQNPRPLVERLGEYYPSDYSPHAEAKVDLDRTDLSARIRRTVLRRLYARPDERPNGFAGLMADAAVRFRGKDHFGDGVPVQGEGRLLDFGCGSGKLLRQMRAVGWQVTGLDFSEQAVQAAREGGFEVYLGTLPQPEIPPESFDAVTMQHALEHVPDPLDTLRAVREVLRPGGVVMIQVPNFASWEVQHLGEAALQVDLPRHLTHFEPATLSAMLERAGFNDVNVTARARRGFIRKGIRNARSRGQQLSPWLDSGLAHRRLVHRNNRNGTGGELVATARKPSST